MNPNENNVDYLSTATPGPDQSAINFDSATSLEINHDDAVGMSSAQTVDCPPSVTSEKYISLAKVMVAVAIVATAGYIAYWVQEPVNLKADVISNTPAASSTSTSSNPSTSSTSSSSSLTDPSPKTTSNPSTTTVKNIDLSLFGFEPAVLKVDVGTTVKWTNSSPETQTIIGTTTDGTSFTSSPLKSGDSYTFTFDKDTEVEYYSTYIPALKAIITVGTGKTAAATTTDTSSTDSATSATEATSTDSTTSAAEATTAASDTTSTDKTATDTLKPAASDSSDSSTTPVIAKTDAQKAKDAIEEVASKGAAPETNKSTKHISKTGPEDALYLLLALGILYGTKMYFRPAGQKA